MRRKDREVKDLDEIAAIMQRCDVCRLAFTDEETGYPYILPVNFGMSVEEGVIRLYFHSATEGYKVHLIEKGNPVSFELDGKHELQYFKERGYCTFSYESVVGHGRLSILEGEEKVKALTAMMDHYHPGAHAYFNPAAIPRTLVYCLTVEGVTGKRKPLQRG